MPQHSKLVQIAFALERASKSRVVISLFIAALLVVPAAFIYRSTEKSWSTLTGLSERAERRVFPRPEPTEETVEDAPLAEGQTAAAQPTVDGGQPAGVERTAPVVPPSATASDVRLQRVLSAWDRLPENIRNAVDTLVAPYVEGEKAE